MKLDHMFLVTSLRANYLNQHLPNIMAVSNFGVKLHDKTCANWMEGKKNTYVAINDVLNVTEGTAILLHSNY